MNISLALSQLKLDFKTPKVDRHLLISTDDPLIDISKCFYGSELRMIHSVKLKCKPIEIRLV